MGSVKNFMNNVLSGLSRGPMLSDAANDDSDYDAADDMHVALAADDMQVAFSALELFSGDGTLEVLDKVSWDVPSPGVQQGGTTTGSALPPSSPPRGLQPSQGHEGLQLPPRGN